MIVRKINDIEVKPLNIKKVDPETIKGKDYFPTLAPNILLLARKNSGKSTVVHEILKGCVNKRTKVYFFCSTVYKDPSYLEIMKMLDKKNVEYEAFTEIIEDKVNHLENIVNKMKKESDNSIFDDENDKNQVGGAPNISFIMFGGKAENKKPPKPKKVTPKFVFVFDDISEDLRNPSVAFLLKKNRHFGIMNIISTQSLKDLSPSAFRQIDFALLFKNLDAKSLSEIHAKLVLPTPLQTFYAIYQFATEGNHNFLYIDKAPSYRQNFCNMIEL